MKRRDFLKYMFATSIITTSQSFGFSNVHLLESNPNLLVIMLRGGADGLSMLVPYNDSYYYEARPIISIPKEKCLPVNSDFGLNPYLKNMFDLYSNGQGSFIPLAGQLNNSRSHFQAQDVMEYGVNNVSHYESGFLARLYEVLGNKNTKEISFTENLTPICSSNKIVIPNLSVKHIYDKYFDLNSLLDFKDNYKGVFQESYKGVLSNAEIIKKIKKSNQNYKLSGVAEFMKAGGYNIGFVDFGDWDTHSQQGSLDGKLKELLLNLDLEIKAFKDGLGKKIWDNTLVVVMSEFGRTLQQNGNGSDHGHGNLMSFFGGLITKSSIKGDWLTLKNKNLHEGRDLIVQYEYRDILSELFIKLYGLNEKQVNYIFPQSNPTKLNII